MPARTAPTVELWMRTHPTGDGEEHDELRRRLAQLDRRGVVDAVTVRTWPHEIAVDGPASRRERAIVDRVRDFRRWATGAGVELPAFAERSTAGVGRMGPAYTALRLPRTALAVYREGILTWVAPCVERGEERTPREWIENAADGAAPGCDSGAQLVV
jgi:hypothetical protein